MMRKVVAMLALALVLVGCSPISEGYITEKKHEEGHWYTVYVQHCVYYNTKGLCKRYTSVPQQNYMPPSWWFGLREQTDGLNGHEPKVGWTYVGPETYDKYEVGEYYAP